jgi:predicted O-methyltransferase YrrM
LVKPEFILEIGTFTGYGSLCLAEGLTQTGQLHTIEPNPEVLFIAEKYFNLSPFKHQIFTHLGKAENVIPNFPFFPFFEGKKGGGDFSPPGGGLSNCRYKIHL